MSSTQEEMQAPLSMDLIAAEYAALREEILKLTDIQTQNVVITLVSFGSILTVGTSIKNAAIMLAYPVLTLILAIWWISTAHGIDMLGSYIQHHIEQKVGTQNIGWENFSRKDPIPHVLLTFWGSRGIFVATQIVALIVGLSFASISLLTILLTIIATASTITCLTIFMNIALTQGRGKRLVG